MDGTVRLSQSLSRSRSLSLSAMRRGLLLLLLPLLAAASKSPLPSPASSLSLSLDALAPLAPALPPNIPPNASTAALRSASPALTTNTSSSRSSRLSVTLPLPPPPPKALNPSSPPFKAPGEYVTTILVRKKNRTLAMSEVAIVLPTVQRDWPFAAGQARVSVFARYVADDWGIGGSDVDDGIGTRANAPVDSAKAMLWTSALGVDALGDAGEGDGDGEEDPSNGVVDSLLKSDTALCVTVAPEPTLNCESFGTGACKLLSLDELRNPNGAKPLLFSFSLPELDGRDLPDDEGREEDEEVFLDEDEPRPKKDELEEACCEGKGLVLGRFFWE